MSLRYGVLSAYGAMIFIVVASNYLVQFTVNDWLTLAAFSYPLSFLVTELTNRVYGPKKARQIVYVGFLLGVILSIWLATPRIAMASGTAFLISQLLDISIFNRLRQGAWWYAPFFASAAASIVDTALFWGIAFWGEPVPLVTWAIGDLAVKFLMDVGMLAPFRLAIVRLSINNPT
jgi:queuosine precursor transporter